MFASVAFIPKHNRIYILMLNHLTFLVSLLLLGRRQKNRRILKDRALI